MREALRRAGALVVSSLIAVVLNAGSAAAEPALPDGFQDTIAFGNLEQPVAFRFSPDERVFVAEKGGLIKVYDDLEDEEPTVFADLRTKVYDHGDRGLLGLALDPEFPKAPYVYALYTYDHILGDPEPPPKWGKPETVGDECSEPKGADDCLVSGRLVRLTAAEGEDHALPSAKSPTELPLAEGWCQQFSSHSIGDLHFGPEGALYVSGGDGASFTGLDYGQLGTPPNPCGDPPLPAGSGLSPPGAEGGALRSQNLQNLSGKILRLDPETGEAWPDNPLVGSPNATTRKVVAYGFRNPFRFTIDPQTGEIYTGNVGSSELEEIDRFAAPPKATYNSGWPCYEGPVRQFLFKELGLAVCESLYAGEPSSTSQPFFYFSHLQEVVPEDECSYASGSAIGGISFYEGGDFPLAYDGALFFSDPVRGCIYVMHAGEDGRPDPLTTERFLREAQVYPGVDIEEGPDGTLYYASLFGDEEFGPGAIHRIVYVPGAPKARLEASPQWGSVESGPLQVDLDAGASSDPDEDPLEYDWDIDGNGTFETHGGEAKQLEFTKEGLEEIEKEAELNGEKPKLNRVVAVRVSDGEFDSVARTTLYPGDEPPKPLIELPKPTEKWGVGQKITLIGSALDSNGGKLTGLSLYWSTRIAHCPTGPENCHKHPLQVFAGLKEGSFLAPEHDYPSFIEITLRATDKRGLAASKTIQIDPRTVQLAMSTSPPGIPLTAGLLSGPAPFSLTAIEGSNVALAAPSSAQLNGRTYTFQSWSDGGARAHTVLASASAGYQALYATTPDPPKDEPPSTVLRKHPPKLAHSRKAKFTFTSSEPGSRFRCKLDSGPYRACRSPLAYRKLKRGRHVFRVYAIDAAGNVDRTPASFVWKVR